MPIIHSHPGLNQKTFLPATNLSDLSHIDSKPTMKKHLNASILTFARASGVLCLVLLAWLAAGCRTGEPTSSSFASVVIKGKSTDEICKTAASVFQEDGYQVASLAPQNMVFQKEGSRGQSLAYSGVVDTHYGGGTVVRVRAQLVDLGAGGQRLQCKAYMVQNAGDSFFEDESALLNIRSRPYQKLLNKVADRLK